MLKLLNNLWFSSYSKHLKKFTFWQALKHKWAHLGTNFWAWKEIRSVSFHNQIITTVFFVGQEATLNGYHRGIMTELL